MKIVDACTSRLGTNLSKIRQESPLIHSITNYVVMNFTANVLLATGASPVMAHAKSEVEEMVAYSKALVLNIGTLDENWIGSMILAGQKATELKIPIILDPVGSGATKLRTSAARTLLKECNITIIRGNASEILSLTDNNYRTRGVDASHSVDEATNIAAELAQTLETTLAITGETDIVTDGKTLFKITGGNPLMAKVTGTGCASTAMVAAFAGVESSATIAATSALAFMAHAGSLAASTASGPGTFVPHFIDALYKTTAEQLEQNATISMKTI